MPIQYKRHENWPIYQKTEIVDENLDVIGCEIPVCYRFNRLLSVGFEIDFIGSQLVPNNIFLKHPDGKSFCLDNSGWLIEQKTSDDQVRVKPYESQEFEDLCESFNVPKYRKQLGEKRFSLWDIFWIVIPWPIFMIVFVLFR